MAGRPAKPTKLKVLQGTARPDRLPRNEPQPTPGMPTRPEWLSPEAKREWNRLAPELVRLGLLTPLDRGLFVMRCQSWALYKDALKDIAEHGTTFTTDKGYEGPRPSVGIMIKMISVCAMLGSKFGLSPSDRAKMSVPTPEDEDEFTKFLKQRSADSDVGGDD